MQDSALNKIIGQIADISQSTSAEILEKMQLAMETAMENPAPAVQAMWNSIPKQGTKPTLEEFMNYLIERNLLIP